MRIIIGLVLAFIISGIAIGGLDLNDSVGTIVMVLLCGFSVVIAMMSKRKV